MSTNRTKMVIAALVVAFVGLPLPWQATPVRAATDLTLVVDTLADDPALVACTLAPDDCSLRGAIAAANVDNGGDDTILVPAGRYELGPNGPDGSSRLEINFRTHLIGAGSAATVIDANSLGPVITIVNGPIPTEGRIVFLDGLTLTGGRSSCGFGTFPGALYVWGHVTTDDVVVTGNTSCGGPAGVYLTRFGSRLDMRHSVISDNTSAGGGAGIEVRGTLLMSDSSIVGNVAQGSGGGGMLAMWDVYLTRVTIANNTAKGAGGGISAGDDSTGSAYIEMTDSTVSGNVATWYTSGTPQPFPGSGAGFFLKQSRLRLTHTTVAGNVSQTHPQTGGLGNGGGITTIYSTDIVMKNSVVAGNQGQNECSVGAFTSIGSFGCSTTGLQDPQLSPLADNGGATLTHLPIAGSPVLDIGNSADCTAADQRGIARPQGAGCDAGSVERGVAPPPPPSDVVITDCDDPALASLANVVGNLTITDLDCLALAPAALTSVGGNVAVSVGGPIVDLSGVAVGGDLSIEALVATSVAGRMPVGDTVIRMRNAATTMTLTIPEGALTTGTAFHATTVAGAIGPAGVLDPLDAFDLDFGTEAISPRATIRFDIDLASLDIETRDQVTSFAAAGLVTIASQLTAPGSAWIGMPVCGPAQDPMENSCVALTSSPTTVTLVGLASHFSRWAAATVDSPPPPPPPGPNAWIDDVTVDEGNTGTVTATLAIHLSAASTHDVVLDVQTRNGTATAPGDYTAMNSSITIPAGQTSASVQVAVNGDQVRELGETFEVRLVRSEYATITDGDATVTIREPAFGTFHAGVTGGSGTDDAENAYLLLQLSHYVYDSTARDGSSAATFAAAFRERFDGTFPDLEVVSIVSDGLTDTQVAVLDTGTALIVVVRGTEQPTDFAVDFMLNPIGGVHAGFLGAASSVYDNVSPLVADARGHGRKIWLTGHSLGGAIAEVLAYQLESHAYDVQGVVTFGAPRAFAGTTIASYEGLIPEARTQRWVDNNDPVPHLPPGTPVAPFYGHVGQTNNIVQGGSGCVIALNTTERFAGGNFDDHDSARYAARILVGLGLNASLLPDPPQAPGSMPACGPAPTVTQIAAAACHDAATLDGLRGLMWDHGLDPTNAAAALTSAGCTVEDVMLALEDLRMNHESIIRALLGAGGAAFLDRVIETSLVVWQDPRDFLANLLESMGHGFMTFAGHFADHLSSGAYDWFAERAQRVGVDPVVIGRFLVDRFHLGAETLAGVLSVARYTGAQAATALKTIFALSALTITLILKNAGFDATGIARALSDVWAKGPGQVADYFRTARFSAAETAEAIWNVFRKGMTDVIGYLKAGGFATIDIGGALLDYYGQTAQQAANALWSGGFTADQAASVLKSVYGRTHDAAAGILKTAKFTVVQIATAIKAQFGLAISTVVGDLKAIGYGVLDVGRALKDGLGQSAQQAIGAMLDKGYTVTDTMNVAKSIFSKNAATAVQIHAALLAPVVEVSKGVAQVFSLSASQVAKLLWDAGYTFNQIVSGIVSAFNMSVAAVLLLLAQLRIG